MAVQPRTPVATGEDERTSNTRRLLRTVATSALSVAVVALLRWLLHPVLQEGLPYTLFLASVAVSAHREGWRCGVISTVLSVIVGTHLFVMPWDQLTFDTAVDLTLVAFVTSAALVVRIIEREASQRRLAQEGERLLRESSAERARLERELEEARRLESLGRLAGGVAHDFNNLMMVVLTSAEMLRERPGDTQLLDAISVAGTRATEITKQLLGLGRRQMMVTRPLSINDSVREAVQLCGRLFPENVQLRADMEHAPWLFLGDRTLMQQILLNLLTNARDALPDGGSVEIETKNVALGDEFALTHPAAVPGDYVRLSVTDNGVGMDADTRERLFEPFFTSKPHGTGLGLAVVYGLVKQLQGLIFVDTNPGRGTRFDVYLPRAPGEGLSDSEPPAPERSAGRRMRVLLVEDHPLVRSVVERMLQRVGHSVRVAADGESALLLASEQSERFDVLVTDIGMPWMDGRQLAELLRSRQPDLGVVLISGYDDNQALQRTTSAHGFIFLRKPFATADLETAIARARGARGRSTSLMAISHALSL